METVEARTLFNSFMELAKFTNEEMFIPISDA